MGIPFSRAPHIEGVGAPLHPAQAPNAALLIDFDNVTMGMRSDLSKELKTLLNSDVIKGKVTVQRAYADWRRYPQYIVPLSEASIDLIFAPAYGSSKKNATDIRMAIDGMELVFTRPEIGTFILLTGDSDFSSLVLKLKEYGKYVIGVGIQESSSDILVQNCDEYYSYTSLSGLRKTEDGTASQMDPWALVERAVEQMSRRDDVMRSDRLKQVMLEIDPAFDEKSLGFNKFSRFISEAGKKGILQLQKMENGQYEIVPPKGGGKRSEDREGRRSGRNDRGRSREPRERDAEAPRTEVEASRGAQPAAPSSTPPAPPVRDPAAATEAPTGDPDALGAAYALLRRAVEDLIEDHGTGAARDSDVKRRMLALDGSFDEAQLGFSKFSRFLRHAHDEGVIELRKEEAGHHEVTLGVRAEPAAIPSPPAERKEDVAPAAGKTAASAGRLRPRETTVGPRGGEDDVPPLLEGQIVRRAASGGSGDGGAKEGPSQQPPPAPDADSGEEVIDPELLQLPSGAESVVQYLSNSYAGVGKKTAETLVEALGDRLFHVLQSDPARVSELLPAARAEKFLEAWDADLRRRRERHLKGAGSPGGSGSNGTGGEPAGSRASTPRRGRTRRTRGGR